MHPLPQTPLQPRDEAESDEEFIGEYRTRLSSMIAICKFDMVICTALHCTAPLDADLLDDYGHSVNLEARLNLNVVDSYAALEMSKDE